MSTLSSVTDGQLCEDGGSTPGCPPKLVVQTSSNQAVVAVTPVRLVTENGAGATVTMRQSTQVVLGGAQAPSVLVSNAAQRVLATGGQQGVQGVPGPQGPRGDAGAVTSINGKVGDVVLDAPDVNADPEGAAIAAASSAMAMHLADPDPHGQYVADGDVLNGGNF